VRQQFPQRPSAEVLYDQLRKSALGIADFQISKEAGSDAAAVFIRASGASLNAGIAGIYTKPGQIVFIESGKQRIEALAEGDWVLARPPLAQEERSRLLTELQRRYWQDYCPQWQQLLADLSMAPPSSLTDAKRKLELLAQPNSPLRRLLPAIAEHTRDVPQCLESLNQMLIGQSPTPLDSVLGQLDELAAPLAQLVGAEERGERFPEEPLADFNKRLEQLPASAGEPMGRWLEEFTDPLPIWLSGGIRKEINNSWRREALAFCRTVFRNRYPLAPLSSQDVTLADFSKFFGAGGVLERFLYGGEQYRLSTFVDMTKDTWVWRSDVSKEGIPGAKLQQLRFGTQLKEAFFSAGSPRPAVRFELTPLSLDDKASRVVLELDAQQLSYAHGSATSQSWWWPGPRGSGRARLQFFPKAGASAPVELNEDGEWGWFRLLDRARITPLADEDFQLAFEVGDYHASFTLRASSAVNPFRLKVEDFRCPQTL
jgi:type VI secretion system protein ImpL